MKCFSDYVGYATLIVNVYMYYYNLNPKFVQKKEVNTLLDDIIKHLTPDRAFESHYSDLMSVISRIVTHMTDYNHVFSMVS